MSLRAFHVLFIVISIIFSLVFAVWCFANSAALSASGVGGGLLWGGLSLSLGIGLVFYASTSFKRYRLLTHSTLSIFGGLS